MKYLRALQKNVPPSQSLLPKEVERLGLVTTKKDETYPEESLQSLLLLPDDELLDIKTKYSATVDGESHHAGTIKRVHSLAESQVNGYATSEREYQANEK